tara:strand:+ start:1765 stop:1920 length:156 start_codon:yes stop_codon:yes gene_type:complete
MSKKELKLYHPKAGDNYVIPHPSKVEQMKHNGWVEKPVIKTMSKEKSHGKS